MGQKVESLIRAALNTRFKQVGATPAAPTTGNDVEEELRIAMVSDLPRLRRGESPLEGYVERMTHIAAASSWHDLRWIDALNCHWEADPLNCPFAEVYAHALRKLVE